MKKQLVTRKDFEELLFRVINPVKDYYSESYTKLDLGHTGTHYEDESIPMESFSSIMWGLVPFWAGGGEDKDFDDIFLNGKRRPQES